jgi:hypothetical protein
VLWQDGPGLDLDVVSIDGSVIATAPDPAGAALLQRGLSALPARAASAVPWILGG